MQLKKTFPTSVILPLIEKTGTYSKFFLLILSLWFGVNFLQSWFTELNPDEAYYWMYSRFPAWGYFDHPPMIAAMIRIGYSIFENEAGVRLVTVITQLGTLSLLWAMVAEDGALRRNVLLFFGIAASVIMFQVYGFVAVPDSPLLFFAALLLFGYKKFLPENSFPAAAIMAIAMAGLIYSKYQGGVLILLLIISNLKLLKEQKFWWAGIAALALCIPHFYWQYANEFPSFKYHFVSRSNPFRARFFLEYLPNQLAVFNPFVFGLIVYLLVRYRSPDAFERTLRVIIIGFIVLFWLSTFRGHAEPHWTVIAAIPMILIIYKYALANQKIGRYAARVAVFTVIISGIGRLLLATDLLKIKTGFNGQRAWTTALRDSMGRRPMVFTNSYQRASLYTFYTGIPAISLNDVFYRQNQFDLWPMEESLQAKAVGFSPADTDSLSRPVKLPSKTEIGIHLIDSFYSVQRLQVKFSAPPHLKRGGNVVLTAEIFNPYDRPVAFDIPGFRVTFFALFINKNQKISLPFREQNISPLAKKSSRKLLFSLPGISIHPGEYAFGISARCGPIREGFNSQFAEIVVE